MKTGEDHRQPPPSSRPLSFGYNKSTDIERALISTSRPYLIQSFIHYHVNGVLMLQLLTNTPLICQSAGAVLHSSNFLTTVVLPSVVRAASNFPSSRDRLKQLRTDDTMQLQRQAGQLTGQTRPSQQRLVPVASLGALKAQPCRATAAGPSPASASWGSSMVGPSFAASPLQHRYVLAVDIALQSPGHAWQA